MIKLIYEIDNEDVDHEREWLNNMKIYPAFYTYHDWIRNKIVSKVGVIVSKDAALAIKLRHSAQFQKEYTGK